MEEPVLGFLEILLFLFLEEKVPKPLTSTLSLFSNELETFSKIDDIPSSTSLLFKESIF